MIILNGEKIEQNKFPDGTLLMKNTICPSHVNEIFWKYENDSELFALICLVKSLREHITSSLNIELTMSYIPHARQDRVKNPEDIFTLKYFCEIINSLNFNCVNVLDAHSNVSLALLDRVKETKPNTEIYDIGRLNTANKPSPFVDFNFSTFNNINTNA